MKRIASQFVMAGLVPAIHVFTVVGREDVMPGIKPGMTGRGSALPA
jgi:hypothetical protein